MFNVGFLSSGVTRAVRRDVLMMCVSAGKSVEIAWRRCVGIGSRGHIVHSKFLSDKKPSVGQLVIKSVVNLQI